MKFLVEKEKNMHYIRIKIKSNYIQSNENQLNDDSPKDLLIQVKLNQIILN